MSLILVTGGCGFIGSHIVDMLIDAGHKVVVVDNLSTGSLNNLNTSAEFLNLDITNGLVLTSKLSKYKFDYVFHLAAQINLRESIKNPGIDANINIVGMINVLFICINSKAKFIFASTGGAIYAPNYDDIPWTENHETNPQSPYGLSKFCAEKYIELLNSQHDFDYAILRLSNVYGPRQNAHGEAGIVAIFQEKISNGIPCTIFGTGLQTRDFVYVEDVAKAFITAMSYKVSGTFNVSTRTEISVYDLTHDMFRVLEKNPDIKYADKIPGELERSCLSYNKLFKISQWEPAHSMEKGLIKTLKGLK